MRDLRVLSGSNGGYSAHGHSSQLHASPTSAGLAAAAQRERLYRGATLAGVALILLLLIHLTATSTLTSSALAPALSREHLLSQLPDCNPTLDSVSAAAAAAVAAAPPPSPAVTVAVTIAPAPAMTPAPSRPVLSNRTRMLEITSENRNIVYLHRADILVMTMAKAGTSTTWHWLYPGITGRSKWNMTACKTYVHDMRSDCWNNHTSFLYSLPSDEQWRILTSPSTFRLAIQRNPYERTISSFKSKFTCEDKRFGTDLHNREVMVPILRNRCGAPKGGSCMNITEFADVLDLCRRRKGIKGFLPALRVLDVHIRPQEMYFDEIDYNMVIDVNDLSDLNVLQPVIDRLEFKDLVKDGPNVRHSSGDDQLHIPENSAAKLYAYALESRPGALKYVPGHEPRPV